jgi:hypothetical protein
VLEQLAAGAATVAFTFTDPRITESSGLATASTGDLVYTHNDSGDDGRVFAVGPDGATRTAYVLPGVEPRDWEDMARGPDEQGRSSLWLGDIGDNNAVRENGLLVHRVLEPEPTDREEVTTEPPTELPAAVPRRAGGRRDAAGAPAHRPAVRRHQAAGRHGPRVRRARAPRRRRPNLLELVAEAPTQATGTPGGPGIGTLANSLVTAGDVTADGSRVALRTYTDVYEWTVPVTTSPRPSTGSRR